MGLRLGSGAGRVDDDSLDALEFVRFQRAAKEVADLDRDAAQTFGAPRGFVECCQHRGIAFDGMDFGTLGQGQRKGADPGEKLGELAGRADGKRDCVQKGALPLGGRLQEGTGRRGHHGAAKALHRLGAQGDQFAIPCQPGKALRLGQTGEVHLQRGIGGFGAGHHHVRTGKAAGDGQGHFAAARTADPDQRFKRRKGGDQVWMQQLALRHGDQSVRGTGVKTEQNPALGAAGGQGGAAARPGRRGHNGPEQGRNPLPRQRALDDAQLPIGDKTVSGMLHQAAAAGPGMDAGRAHPVDRGSEDAGVEKFAVPQITLDHLTRQHVRQENRAVRPGGHTVAQMAQTVHSQYHSAASSTSVPMKPPD